MKKEIKFAIAQVAFMLVATVAVMSLHYVPNHYCVAAFNLPCDITQK